MHKSVYSVVLMDDVVAAVDRLAYEAGTSRSNMMNRILAEYTELSTPEQQMQNVFSALSSMMEQQNIFKPIFSASDAMFTLRSALQYKYNPSMRYSVELYPHAEGAFGELRAGLRTQNPALLLYLSQFFRLWARLEASCLNGPARDYTVADGRYVRRLLLPQGELTAERLAEAIAGYIRLFDTCLKTYFESLDTPPRASAAVQQCYTDGLDSETAQL